MNRVFSVDIAPNWEGLVGAIMRIGKPGRVHYIELFLDFEVSEAICQRYGLLKDLDPSDGYYAEKREIAVQSFLGYDHVRCGLAGLDMPLKYMTT